MSALERQSLILAALERSGPEGRTAYELTLLTCLDTLDTFTTLVGLEGAGQITSEWSPPYPAHEPRRRLYWLVR